MNTNIQGNFQICISVPLSFLQLFKTVFAFSFSTLYQLSFSAVFLKGIAFL